VTGNRNTTRVLALTFATGAAFLALFHLGLSPGVLERLSSQSAFSSSSSSPSSAFYANTNSSEKHTVTITMSWLSALGLFGGGDAASDSERRFVPEPKPEPYSYVDLPYMTYWTAGMFVSWYMLLFVFQR